MTPTSADRKLAEYRVNRIPDLPQTRWDAAQLDAVVDHFTTAIAEARAEGRAEAEAEYMRSDGHLPLPDVDFDAGASRGRH